MGWLHGQDEGQRSSILCRHGKEGYCHACQFPSAAEVEADRLAAEVAEEEELRIAAEKSEAEADEEAASAKKEADFLASLSPYALAVYEERWEDAYALLPAVCYLHEFDADGYPPPPKRLAKPTFTAFWEVMQTSWKQYKEVE